LCEKLENRDVSFAQCLGGARFSQPQKMICPPGRFFDRKARRAKAMPTRRTTRRTTKKKKKKQRRVAPAAHPIWKKARRSAAKRPALVEGNLVVDGTVVGTGFVQERDPRDGNFPLGAVTGAVDDPRSKEKVWQLPPHLLNQGSTNSCVGHACAHFILTAPIMSHSVDPIALWHRAQEIDEFPGNEGTNSGTSVRAGFGVLREKNLITTDYRWAANADEALRFILTRGPVVVGSKWYPGMGSPANGVMRLTGDPGSTGHAYLLFGFSPDQDAFMMANSWGPGWGIDGCAFLRYDALDQLMQQEGVVCSAIED
jgi:papain like protease